MAHDAQPKFPVVGLSGNVLLSGARDGIAIYTAALERALFALGVPTRRIGAPRWKGGAPGGDANFGVPLPATMALTALTGAATPFARTVERAIDVYHATDYRIPRLSRTPVVATLYDAIPLAHPQWASSRLRATKNRLLRSGAAAADLVLAISESAVDELVLHYRIPRARIRVAPLGVAEDWFAPHSSEARARIARSRGLVPGYFLSVGTLQPRKNIAALVAAHDRLPAELRALHPLVIAGRYGWGVPELRALLDSRRADREVIWLDDVAHDELRALYANAGAFVFPSLAEGFGLPVLEALAAGIPVIASDLPVLREVAGEEATFVATGDTDSLAAALFAATAMTGVAAKAELRRMQARKFDWLTCARRTLDAYREVLGGRTRT